VDKKKQKNFSSMGCAMSDLLPAAYQVRAYNSARESENKIHDDGVARRFGFTGGLVPGVDVYGYMAHLPVARWGRAWLERGTAECRFASPVYDGAQAIVTAGDAGERMTLAVHSGTAACASGAAELPAVAGPLPDAAAYRAASPPATRPPASAETLVEGTWLGMTPLHVTGEVARAYLAALGETDPLYTEQGLLHPGLILRTCNWALTHNVVLGPWIHVGSRVRNLAAGLVGETLGVRARVAANYRHKGHGFVELDALVIAGSRPLAQISHTAIWQPRQLAG
jgi:hypothetical protein